MLAIVFVTNTCFGNKRVVYADGQYRGRHPMMMGSTFIHTKQETNDYVHSFQTLFEHNSNLRNIKALGTDGDEAIMNASLSCFEPAITVHLLCSDHKKGNIERKPNELRASEAASKHILADIFGRRTGSIKENELIDSECVSEFDKSC